MKVAPGVTYTFGMLVVAMVPLVLTGCYNVAASKPHTGVVAGVLSAIQESSVHAHAKKIEVPSGLDDPSRWQVGLHHYQEMCVTCHGAPGVEPSEVGKGLNPRPPDLSEAVKEYNEKELYWIVKHGIKMTGMPAFGATHTDEELWGLVAFLRRLPELSAQDYRASLSKMEAHGSGHSHGHGAKEAAGAHQHDAKEPREGRTDQTAKHDPGDGHDHAASGAGKGAKPDQSTQHDHADSHSHEEAAPQGKPGEGGAHEHAPSSGESRTSEHEHAPSPGTTEGDAHSGHGTGGTPGERGGQHEGHEPGSMPGLYGPYPMTREASGTSWQPELAPMEGAHLTAGRWMVMLHGWFDSVYDYQSGPRGDELFFSSNMLMAMARRPLGPGSVGLRGMISLEPFTMGAAGYPLLLQTGETTGGKPLIDRQHPHDLFMELSASYALHLGRHGSLFAYAGLPGEPALGPPAFMHRFSGMANPEAPISHHWLDSTHITYGVATLGASWRWLKLEGSIFTGQEPDERRWDIEKPTFDSWSARLSLAPTPSLSLQVSYGHLIEPEALEPGVNVDRITASASYHRAWSGNEWQTTFAWGRNIKSPGATTDAFLLESALRVRCVHTIFGRLERTDKDELFAGEDHGAHGEEVFTASKLSVGYRYDFLRCGKTQWGLGALGSAYLLPEELEDDYGSRMPFAFMIFSRIQLGRCSR